MTHPKIIRRYILKEMLTPFLISLLVFNFLMIMAKIMELTDLVVSRGLELSVVLELIFYAMPLFLVWTLPMAVLLGVLLAFLRMNADFEVTAMKASGVSPWQFLPPVAVLAIGAWLSASALAAWAMPWGNHQFENLIYRLAGSNADLALKERQFLDSFPNMIIYVGGLPGGGLLTDVFIVDQRDPERSHTLVAKRGKLFPAKAGKLRLRLYDGSIHAVGKKMKASQNATFKTYDVNIAVSVADPKQRTGKHRKEMYMGEMLEAMSKAEPGSTQYFLLDMELQQKFSQPFACLVMALLGMTMGMQTRSNRSGGVAWALAIFLVYYMTLSTFWAVGETGAVPPRLGVWVPNIIFGVLGVLMLRWEIKGVRPAIMVGLDRLPVLLGRLRRRFGRGDD